MTLTSTEAPRRLSHVVARAPRVITLTVLSVLMLVPLYVLIISVFKPQQAIFDNPIGLPFGQLTLEYLVDAITSPRFNVIKAYGITAFFVVFGSVSTVLLGAPAAYVIARGRTKWHIALLLFFVSATFIPGQAILIPAIYVLRWLGLMGTVPGFLLFQVAGGMAMTIFLFTAYIRTIPRDLDEAAAIDGAGRFRAFWLTIFPLMKPIVATVLILQSLSIWNDFVTPQVILGPGSGIYTVTTGVYAAISENSTNYNLMFPTLLLAVAPALVFFLIMQRQIIGGLVSGATKG
jgi:raffinose/stachyose/melibiose transport system permease protein